MWATEGRVGSSQVTLTGTTAQDKLPVFLSALLREITAAVALRGAMTLLRWTPE